MMTHDPASTARATAAANQGLTLLTDQVIIRASTDETGGSYALLEYTTPPAGGFPPHAHRYDDFTLVVLDGVYHVLVGDREILLVQGDAIAIPRGTVHGFVNPGCRPSRMLVIATPGVIHGQFLAEVGDRAGRSPWEADLGRILAVAPKYGIEFRYPDGEMPRCEPVAG